MVGTLFLFSDLCCLVQMVWPQWHVLISNSSLTSRNQFRNGLRCYALIVIEVPTDIMRDHCIQLFVSFCLKGRNYFEFKSETADTRHLNGPEKQYRGPKIHRKVDHILVKVLNHPPGGQGVGSGFLSGSGLITGSLAEEYPMNRTEIEGNFRVSLNSSAIFSEVRGSLNYFWQILKSGMTRWARF